MSRNGNDSSEWPATGAASHGGLVETGDMIRVMMQLGYDYFRQDELHLHFGMTPEQMKAFMAANPCMEIAFKKGQMFHKLLDRNRAMTSGKASDLIRLGIAVLGQQDTAKPGKRNRQDQGGTSGGPRAAERSADLSPIDKRKADRGAAAQPVHTRLMSNPEPDPADEISSSQESGPEFRRPPVPLSRLIRQMK